jgi:putative polyhydroxyalkanoate system protein
MVPMTAIHMSRPYTMPFEELKEGLDELADKLGEHYQLDCGWESDECLAFSRNGLNGQLSVDGETIDLSLKLGMLMSPFKSVIEREISAFMDEHIY